MKTLLIVAVSGFIFTSSYMAVETARIDAPRPKVVKVFSKKNKRKF